MAPAKKSRFKTLIDERKKQKKESVEQAGDVIDGNILVCSYTFQPVYKDHLRKENSLAFVHRWSLITGSFMQKMINWEIKSVVIDRELLNKGGL